MRIRPEQDNDQGAIRAVLAAAFADPDLPDDLPVEVGLVDKLRASDSWIPSLSLVAIVDDRFAGHVVFSRARVEGTPVLALGPIGVAPPLQGRGIGTALVEAAIDAAGQMAESLIGLVGDPSYYSRFGFVPGPSLAITAHVPEWEPGFQVRRLAGYRPEIRGRFEYAAPFYEL